MDVQIRHLLTTAKKHGASKGSTALQKAYDLLRNVAETRLAVDTPEAFGQDLYIICSETAFQHGQQEMAKECLKMYFMKTPPSNQFLCRAYLCQARLLAPTTADSTDQLDKAVVYLIKAINLSKENTRYHFMVYNASVVYWHFCRPFLKPAYRQYLAQSLHQVVKALDDIDDQDYEWRAQLMIALIECHMDAGRRSDASHIATAAASFIKQHVPTLYKTVFGLMVQHQLVEVSKLNKDMKASPGLNIYYKICRLKILIDQPDPNKDVAEEMQRILAAINGQQETDSTSGSASKPNTAKERSRASTTPEERRKKSPAPAAALTPVRATTANRRRPLADNVANDAEGLSEPTLLMELARVATQQNLPDVATHCVDMIKDLVNQVKEQSFLLEFEFLQCELMVKVLGEHQESYHKAVIEVRQTAIKRCEEAIVNAVRLSAPHIIQVGCVTMWNLCLPLLQPNLRLQVRRPLTVVAEALEDIQSLLILLRCQVHMELAKCEEDQEQIQGAMTHLEKALGLDDSKVYEERLQVALLRLQLRAQLYTQPERPEHQAAMIIEQARKADSGTTRMKRSLLVRAGEALAPDAFMLVLDSESDTKEETSGKGPMTVMTKLGGRARNFTKGAKKAVGHLRRLGNENDRERSRLWGDLAKTARKQEVWDVCRVAAHFCLLYDDGRWKNEPIANTTSQKEEDASIKGNRTEREKSEASSRLGKDTGNLPAAGSRPATPEQMVPLYDKDLIRMLAEVNFIQGESLIHLLRTEGVELGELPNPPEDKRMRPKGYVPKKSEEDPDWIEYCDWLKSVSGEAVASFLRAAELGVELVEAWVVCCATSYMWNYNNHVLSATRHAELTKPFTALLAGLKKVGHAGETVLLVNLCNALAVGLIQPWLPVPASKAVSVGEEPLRTESAKKRTAPGGAAPKKSAAGLISNDAHPDLRKAVEVCEYAIKVTNGDKALDVVPISIRQPLLQTWILAKQMLQSHIPKGLGVEDETNDDGQNPMTRAMVGVELIQLSGNGIMEFKESPSIPAAVELVAKCNWTDKLIELQLWTRLAQLSYENRDYQKVQHCARLALAFAERGTQSKKTARRGERDKHKFTVEQELFAHVSSLFGQSLLDTAHGKNLIRRKAMKQFLNAAKFACSAGNGSLVMQAARLYWNASLVLLPQPIERELLMEPLTALLHCITATTDKKAFKRDEDDDTDGKGQLALGASVTDIGSRSNVQVGGPEDDLTLRAALYGVLFQAYADKGDWEAGLKAMDQAIADMPRTNHRLLIFKHMVTMKAKLGRNVSMSIQKFKGESEAYVSNMWRRVALCSKEPLEQFQAYQFAIEALRSPESDWQKFDYLLEFGQWLFCNEFSLQDAIDQIEWAADILLNFKPGKDTKRKKSVKTCKGKAKARSPTHGAKPPLITRVSSPLQLSDARKDTGSPDNQTNISENEADINAADYIPIQKVISIGVAPLRQSLTSGELRDVRQLEGLLRAHVMMAEMAGWGSPQHADCILMAHSFVMRIWQTAVASCGPALKEVSKVTAQAGDAVSKGGSAKGRGAGKGGKGEAVKERPKRKEPLDMVPGTMEEWAGYDIPDEVLEAFKLEMMQMTGINKQTITKPALTLHYLDQLVSSLRELGFNHLALPVLALAEAITRDLIKNRPLTALMHLRSMELCLELNLPAGVSFHEKFADFAINEEEQARCREEMSMWKERHVQAAKEEVRLRQTMREETGIDQTKKKLTRSMLKLQDPGYQAAGHLGKQVGLVSLQEVWTDTAEVLLRLAMYQPARQLLTEAFQAAQAFDDVTLQARVLLLLGKLSYAEAQFGQVVNFVTQAQNTHNGDEQFWFETVMLMVDATVDDCSMKDPNTKVGKKFREACGILNHALHVFAKLGESRPNKVSLIEYIIAKMEAKLGSIEARLIFTEHYSLFKPKVFQMLEAARLKLTRSAHQLAKLGYRRQAAAVCRENADILARYARATNTQEEQHAYYLKALSQYKEARQLIEHVLHESLPSVSLLNMRGCCLPVQRQYVEATLVSCAFMLEMLSIHNKHQRDLQVLEQRKNTMVKAVEKLIQEEPSYSKSELEWIETTRCLGEVVLSHLTSAHSLVLAIPHLKCKTLCLLGRSLRIISEQKDPQPPSQWDIMDVSMLNVAEHLRKYIPAVRAGESANAHQLGTASPSIEEVEQQESELTEPDPTSKNFSKNSQIINELKDAIDTSHNYLAQATAVLLQTLSLALNNKFIAEARDAALEMVECLGQYDWVMATQFLALHQSCSGSLYLDQLLHRALVDPTLSQQAALYHQKAMLEGNSTITNGRLGPVYKTVIESLNETSHSWKRISVSPNHLDLAKDFPHNFSFLLLQHSPDRKYLYGAVIDKHKHAHGAVAKQKQVCPQTPTKPKVVRTETSAQELEILLSRFRSLKHRIMQVLLKAEYKRSQVAQREKMLANLDESIISSSPEENPVIQDDVELPLETEFGEFLHALEEYLHPITSLLEGSMRPLSGTTMSNENKNTKHEPHINTEAFVILADQWLLQLPLEALACFQTDTFASLSRDISLQFLHHKITYEPLDEAARKEKDKLKPPTRLPGLRDAAKKQSKIIPLDRTIPPSCLPVDTHGIRYFVDPNLECAETERNTPISHFEKILELYEQQFTPRWLGVMGTEHRPSTGEYEMYILESSALLFYGMERFLGQLPPHKVASLNLTDCQMVLLFDLVQTNKSFFRQSKVDIFKTPEVLALEKPLETALLLSLTGVNCVCLNQWHSSLQENAEKIKCTLKDLLTNGLTTGSMVKMLFTPHFRKIEEESKIAVAGVQENLSVKGKLDKDRGSAISRKTPTSIGDSLSARDLDPELDVPQRHWFNMVCYGAPNLMVTQIGKG